MLDFKLNFDREYGATGWDVTIDTVGDIDITKEIKEDINTLKFLEKKKALVGVFDSKKGRDDGKSNATLGYYHEFGTYQVHPQGGLVVKMPARPFLRLPIADGSFQALIDEKEIELTKTLLKEIALRFLDAVKREFLSGNGHGFWKELSPNTSRRKNKNRTELLRDTEQLYNALDMKVVGK